MPSLKRKELARTLSAIKKRLARQYDRSLQGGSNREHRIDKSTTTRILIEPVLRSLGWDIENTAQVIKDYQHTPNHRSIDFALLVNGMPTVFLQTDALANYVDDPRLAYKCIEHADDAGVEWCIHSNGRCYAIYKSNSNLSKDKRLFYRIDIKTAFGKEQIRRHASILSLFSPMSLMGKYANLYWNKLHVDRMVYLSLSKIAENVEFHKLIKKNSSANISLAQIADSLNRIGIEFSVPRDSEYNNILGINEGMKIEEKSITKMTIFDMIENGLLPVGTVLTVRDFSNCSATVIDSEHVEYRNSILTFVEWVNSVTNKKGISIYTNVIMPDGRPLKDLRN